MTGNVLILAIADERTVPAAALGELLSSIGRDYREQYRRDLLITDIRRGSIIAILKELAEKADAINHIADFVKNLAWVKTLIGDSHGAKGSRSKGARTVKALATAALKTGGEIYLEHSMPDGETLKVHVNPDEAPRLLQPPPRSVAPPERSLLAANMAPPDTQRDQLIAEIAHAAVLALPSDPADQVSVSPQLQLLRALVATIKAQPDGERLIASVTKELGERGHQAAARLLSSL